MGSFDSGAEVVVTPTMDPTIVEQVLTHPYAFSQLCTIVREDETMGYMDLTFMQKKVIDAIEGNKWVYIVKYRQAKVTTVVLMHLLLRDCMFLKGIEGMLIADTNATAEMAFRRLRLAYRHLPTEIKVDLIPGSKGSRRELEFIHGGRIVIKSLEGRAPAVGHSLDRLHITELGEALHQRNAIVNLMPGINKRPNARLVNEMTPGPMGSYSWTMWQKAKEEESKFFPLFLEWWKDDSCTGKVEGKDFSEEELEYMEDKHGMTLRHLAFRTDRLSSDFPDSRMFDIKWPPGPLEGWHGVDSPKIPEDSLRRLYDESKSDPIDGDYGVGVWDTPQSDHRYMIFADPCGFGSSDGDPAALTVFDMGTGVEVAVWSGREDPDRFAVRIELIAKYYNDAVAVVESNHAGCITALRQLNVKTTFSKKHPGWYATAIRIAKAEFCLVKLLRASRITIKSRKGLHQLKNYDGNFKRRMKDEDGGSHHFDRARTYIMAAEYLTRTLKRQDRMDKEAEVLKKKQNKERIPGTIGFDVLHNDSSTKLSIDFNRPPRMR